MQKQREHCFDPRYQAPQCNMVLLIQLHICLRLHPVFFQKEFARLRFEGSVVKTYPIGTDCMSMVP